MTGVADRLTPTSLPAATTVSRDIDYAVVAELRSRVATRLAEEERTRPVLPEADRRQLVLALIAEQLDGWVLHETNHGRAVPTVQAEDDLVEAVYAEVAGLGRLQPLLARGDVEDIYFEGSEPTVLRLADGRKVTGPPIASSDAELVTMLQNLGVRAGGTGRELSTASPLLNVRLKSVGRLGARLAAELDVVPRPCGTIRVHRHVEADLDTLHDMGMVDSPLRAFLRAAVRAGANIVVSGAPAAGKTMLLRSLVAEIPWDQVIVTVEDDRELGTHLLGRHCVVRPYEARPSNAEGVGEISMGDALRQALRDSPDRVVVGETRGGDVAHLLDAMTNGVAGAMCTLHAASAAGVFDRLVQLVLKASPPLPVEYALRASTAIDLIVHVTRDASHDRFVSEVVQVHSGALGESGYPVTTALFSPREDDGRAIPTGHRPTPRLAAQLARSGFDGAWLRPELSDWSLDQAGRAS